MKKSEQSSSDFVVSNESDRWSQANQAYLLAHLARVRHHLEHHNDPLAKAESTAVKPMMHPLPAALDTLCQRFALSSFERDLLLLCAGMELEATFARICAVLHDNPQHDFATLALALATLPEPHWSAITPDAPLRRWQLIQIDIGRSLTRSPIHIDERVLHYLAGVDHLDAQLSGLVQPLSPPTFLAPSQTARVDEIATIWLSADGNEVPVIHLCGTDYESIEAIAAAACAQVQLQLYRMPLSAIPNSPAEIDQLWRLWQRESMLSNRVLLIDCAASERSDAGREVALTHWVDMTYLANPTHRLPLLIASRDRHVAWKRPTLTLEVMKPSKGEQRQFWQAVLDQTIPEGAASLNGHVERLVGQFNLNLPVIVAATQGAQGRLASHATTQPTTLQNFGDALWDLCRSQVRPHLDDLAQAIEAVASWEDLVLPARELTILREIAMHVRQRSHVYETWGFADKGKRGLGISALFVGASGTGKTMAAEVLARELRLDLYRIDLSAVVSKYIGETEKNLRRVFDAAEAGGAILLFDEADALFGKRSDVKDSHDRYANIEVSYLLQRMEAYRGLAILTTNMKDALDNAFVRRIRFIVQFPFPDAEQRAEIWRRVFPANTPVNELQPEKLARLNVAGGNIRNIALHAAFLAADATQEGMETPIGMEHLLAAARREYAKLDRSLTEAEIRGWV